MIIMTTNINGTSNNDNVSEILQTSVHLLKNSHFCHKLNLAESKEVTHRVGMWILRNTDLIVRDITV